MTVRMTAAGAAYKAKHLDSPSTDPRQLRADWAQMTPADLRGLRQASASTMGREAKAAMASKDPREQEWGRSVAESLKQGVLPGRSMNPPIHIESGMPIINLGWGPK